MPTKPAQGGNTGTWGTDLNAFLDVSLNADGTLKSGVGGGGGTSLLQADYLFTTDGTTITRYDRTGAISATGTDLGALVNGVAASYICCQFTAGVFPWTTKMTLDSFVSMSLLGAGGQQNENKGSVGGRGATQFKWTPNSGTAMSAAGSQGLTLSGIAFQYSSATYTVGDSTEDGLPFCSIEGVDHSTPTRHTHIEDCYFGVVSGGKVNCGGPLLDINKTVNISIRNCLFVGGLMHARSHHTTSGDDFANVVEFTACRFSRGNAATFPSIYGSGESWVFRNCHWEPSAQNTQFIMKIVIESMKGCQFLDCWVGDQGSGAHAANTAFIHWWGIGLTFAGGRYTLSGDYALVRAIQSCNGIVISGVDIEDVNDSTTGVIDMQDFTVRGVEIGNIGTWPTTGRLIFDNNTSNNAEAPRTAQPPFKSITASTNLQHTDHDRTIGANATGGAVTVTLPRNTCVGCRITIIKSDASANSVTVDTANGNINASATYSLAAQYKFVTVQATGSGWLILGSN